MKEIKGLNTHLNSFEEDDVSPGIGTNPTTPTYRRLFRLVLAAGRGKPEEALDSIDLIDKLSKAGDEVELSDSELKLLEERVKQNPTQLVDYFLGQLLRKLKEE